MSMLLVPVIELSNGKPTGIWASAQTDALSAAKLLVDAGALTVHLVDLDAQRGKASRSRVTIAAVAAELDVPVSLAAGIADRASAESCIDTGVDLIVTEPHATDEPGLIEWLALRFADRVAVGLEDSVHHVGEVLSRLRTTPVEAYWPASVSLVPEVLVNSDKPVIAPDPGGSADAFIELATFEAGHRQVLGACVGPSLQAPGFDLARLNQVCSAARKKQE